MQLSSLSFSEVSTLAAKVDIVIPARYASTRFPGKSLTKIAGKPMIELVYERASQCKLANKVVVATDDKRIADAVIAFGGEFVMTGDHHNTGTDRLSEVADILKETEIIANVQGDEPLISPNSIDAAIEPLLEDSSVGMSTIAYPITDRDMIKDPGIVKVVLDKEGFALYFSRYPIPYCRDMQNPLEEPRLGHAGLYVYRREVLKKLAALAQTPLELKEKLEQLRALENGIRIKVVVKDHKSPGVDVPEDVAKIEALMKQENVLSK